MLQDVYKSIIIIVPRNIYACTGIRIIRAERLILFYTDSANYYYNSAGG